MKVQATLDMLQDIPKDKFGMMCSERFEVCGHWMHCEQAQPTVEVEISDEFIRFIQTAPRN